MTAAEKDGPRERLVSVNGQCCRIWEKGVGAPVFWLASAPMALRWGDFADAMAASCRLVVCSLPGFSGSRGHEELDDHLAWCLATRDLLAAAGFKPGGTLLASSTAGALAADVAAIWSDLVGTLVLIAPHGLYDAAEPPRDMFALHPRDAARLLAADPTGYAAQIAPADAAQPVLWTINMIRGNEAAARFLWPLGDTRLSRRLDRITARTLVLWGAEDQIIPPSYAERFVRQIGANATSQMIAGAGHLAELDQPAAVAKAAGAFLATRLAEV